MLHNEIEESTSARSLKPVVIVVVAAKLMVASLLLAQATMLPGSPISSAYGLNR
ncbi:hypothetical protein [Rhizobium sp. CECT 9324]|jgi:hypothetical protein|uniref:hypothetical protein n=1 Tax=Rhizobium sp. CECT 9324 TaxID=2845820 RepID=UPI001E3252FA|nr:hypothetical protein [Rhizobium sp. CECT 9324]CAH0341404.1 hypothetical protein RHI9324_03099 [Rhizobium sp. CECT 9324]